MLEAHSNRLTEVMFSEPWKIASHRKWRYLRRHWKPIAAAHARVLVLCTTILAMLMALTMSAYPNANVAWATMWFVVCMVPISGVIMAANFVLAPVTVVLNQYGLQRRIKPHAIRRLEVKRLGPTGRVFCASYIARGSMRRFAYTIPESQSQAMLDDAIAWFIRERDLSLAMGTD